MSGQVDESGGIGSSTPLNRLQSEDHEEVLNVIDQLRSEGISRYVNLPQLVVCGDQSSGKSSVLEAISGLNFPRKDNVCTRFAIELILRRAPASGLKVSIYPDADRPEEEQMDLRNFKPPTLALEHFANIVKSAESAVRRGENNQVFSKDVLRVEVSGPTQPHLTLVDLPGLYHAPDEHQDVDGIKFVESLVRSYMENPRSVMLAVISAKSDIPLQKVTAFTREVDPKGARTLGVITKPDTLPEGSDMEHSFHNLAQNKKVEFRLGWHVLKNRAFEERHCSLAERHELEAKFLSRGIWSSLPRSQAGIHTLVPRLSAVLKDHILSQMPSFITDTHSSLRDTKSSLRKLGDPRQTLSEQRRYLLYSSERYSTLMNNSLNGIYLDPFFGDALDDIGYRKRLRAVVQDRLSDFSDVMEDRGEQTMIIDEGVDFDHRRTCVYRTDFVEEVRKRVRRNRGRELPGTFNPLIVGELFYQQARPWEMIVGEYTDLLLRDVRSATILTLREVLDEHSVEGLLKHFVNNRLSQLEDDVRAKTAELLKPQQAGHPITYNHQFIEIIQKARDQYLRDSVTKKLKAFFGANYPGDPYSSSKLAFCMKDLIDSMSFQTETDMERFTCSEAINCMLAYYQVAMRKFVDDFSNLAVEKCLLEPLLHIFGPRTVERMTDDVVKNIALEDENMQAERRRLTNKLTVLETSMSRLQRLDKHSLTVAQVPDKEKSIDKHEEKREEDMAIFDNTHEYSGADNVSVTPNGELWDHERPEMISEPAYDEPSDWSTANLAPVTKRKKRHSSAYMWE